MKFSLTVIIDTFVGFEPTSVNLFLYNKFLTLSTDGFLINMN